MPVPPRDPAPARSLADVADVLGTTVPDTVRDISITGVCLDSRAVRPGDLYAALPGARTHGARFARGAAELGAAAVLTDPAGAELAADSGLPLVVVPAPRELLGGLAAWLFGAPAEQMLTFGVTGTNGKTTTTFLLDGALRAGGRRCGLIGTVMTRIVDEQIDSKRTTPEAPDLAALMAQMVRRGVEVCSMEVSSHALSMGRVDGIRFDVAGFTNLSQDHLDFHPTMEDYFAAKADLFTPARAKQGVVCVDDEWGRRLARESGVPVVTFTTLGPWSSGDDFATSSSSTIDADWRVTAARPHEGGTDFVLAGPDGVTLDARCPLPGEFNVANTVLALLMLVVSGTAPGDAARWLAAAPAVPGRMEQVGLTGSGRPLAVVDYAHTPDAVATALRALRPSASGRNGPLVVVIGAGGDRDRDKRPKMGAEAARHADVVVVTDDNPRSEVPARIRASVLEGARSVNGATAEVLEVADRREAIATGVRMAGPNGIVLVAGKGHERGQEVAGVVHPFDDREVLVGLLGRPGGTQPVPVSQGRNR
ncbi:UDP-N-acetylmuramoyl-L-alanyl-D-glutamate--2,6-diaminopimelate ligase [Kineosporia corallincola]|uniref:UDP-N-acetylmuramoyl-L-alanyl-D-glutamate--2, 6-diaminopimelate ligase n=1 Tax=Kineosporia corallincola TaxID=2835133 RepID=UPI0027E214B0|nr:UDP-N-acetylmuramoyl-L-alanyl-D-glutamate--2,6-diaminopimelate ligase [Kineosporia corallincola]